MFTHLHVHTEYSLLDGASRITKLLDRVKEFGMDSCAITDHGVMFGVIDFYRAAREAGMRVVGVYDAFFHVSWPEMQQVCHRVIRSFEELL